MPLTRKAKRSTTRVAGLLGLVLASLLMSAGPVIAREKAAVAQPTSATPHLSPFHPFDRFLEAAVRSPGFISRSTDYRNVIGFCCGRGRTTKEPTIYYGLGRGRP
jgi:hypothetical protein